MLSMPQKIHVKRQHYISLRSRLSARLIIQQSKLFFQEARQEAIKQGAKDIRSSFLRLCTFRDFESIEADFGFFVGKPMRADGPFHTGSFPAADYLQATWRGPLDRMRDVHVIIIQSANFMRLSIDSARDEKGLHFGCLLNVFRVGELTEPDASRWETDILFRLGRPEGGGAEETSFSSLPPPLSPRSN